jgi:hypothetical protein
MTNEIKETAGAVQEVAKVVKQVGGFLDTVFGPSAKQFGELMGHRVNFWKTMCLADLAEKTVVLMNTRGLDPKLVRHLGFPEVIPLIEAASYEDNDEVQDLWAKLLASALDPETGVKIENVFVSLLKEIGPAEARLLQIIREHGGPATSQLSSVDDLREATTMLDGEWRCFPEAQRSSAVQNLRRLGCLAPHVDLPSIDGLVVRTRFDTSPNTVIHGVDPLVMNKLVKWIIGQLGPQSGINSDRLPVTHYSGMRANLDGVSVSELLLTLTPLGLRLMDAIDNCPDTPKRDRQ